MRVAAIVPAYNEEEQIGAVLAVLTHTPVISEVIVVNDGCTDGTAAVAGKFPVRIVNLPGNLGKGGALAQGVANTDAPIFFFCDADLVGLRRSHVEALIQPVLQGDADMTVGLFDAGRLATDWAQRIAPFLSGQRALRREVLNDLPDLAVSRYGAEVALSQHADRHGFVVKRVSLPDLSHVMKEEKRGFLLGLAARIRMYWEILRSFAHATLR